MNEVDIINEVFGKPYIRYQRKDEDYNKFIDRMIEEQFKIVIQKHHNNKVDDDFKRRHNKDMYDIVLNHIFKLNNGRYVYNERYECSD